MNVKLGHNGMHSQITRKANEILGYGTKLGTEARSVGQSAIHQVQEMAEKTKDSLIPSKKTLLGLGIITQLLRNREEDDVRSFKLTRKHITDDFVDSLASALEKRLSHSDELKRALVESIQSEVPRLRRLPKEKSSGMGWLTTLGLIVAAGYGLNYLISRYSDGNMMDMATERISEMRHKVESKIPGGVGFGSSDSGDSRHYPTVKHTSAGEMPNADVKKGGSGAAVREKASGEEVTGKTSIRREPEELGGQA